jgi:hypothetical protein|tara:strand:- start:773 stop:1138 length:366 start_codon:yes stop_codon:yes gene_type:complete
MAVLTTDARSPLGTSIVYQAQATSTGDDGLFGTGTSTLYQVSIDNTGNASTDAFVKLYNGTAASSNDPYLVLFCYRQTKKTYAFLEGLPFSGALGLRCVTGEATANTTSPSADVKVYLVGG